VNVRTAVAALSLAGVTACHHGIRTIESDPVARAALKADMHLVNGETTYVTHGPGYELVGRSRGDLLRSQPQLDREAAAFRRVFPNDSLTPLLVTVRRIMPRDKPYAGFAPLPGTVNGTIVRVEVVDASAIAERRDVRGGGIPSVTLPVARAWLSVHTSTVIKKPASSMQADRETEDPRTPAWANAALAGLGDVANGDSIATAVAAHPDELYPLGMFFTMSRPESPLAAGRGGGEGRGGDGGVPNRGGMGGGGRGGMGRGGMGGMGGRGGRGGGVPGGESGRQGDRALPRDSDLFAAEGSVVAQYLLARGGYELIGAMIDGQIRGEKLDDIVRVHTSMSISQLDLDWISWLIKHQASR
jgi:hypothetical protein